MTDVTCSVKGCGKPARSRGWCRSHYMNWWRRGDPLETTIRRTEAELIWAKIRKDDAGCWLWVGTISDGGYGTFRGLGKQQKAHRATYELLVGPVPAGLDLDHLCRVRRCVNPSHLEPVTRSENLRRGHMGKLTHAQRAEIAARFPHEPRKALAAEFGVTTERIAQIGKAA